MLKLNSDFQGIWVLMTGLCTFRMDGDSDTAGLCAKGRNQPVLPYKALKYNDSTSLLHALVCSYFGLLGLILPVFALTRCYFAL
jgi:hypothetical protein